MKTSGIYIVEADDGLIQSTLVWPSPRIYFQVKWGPDVMLFQEVSGLDAEAQVVEYPAGPPCQDSCPVFSSASMPWVIKSGSVTMKKGLYKSDSSFLDWFNQIKMDSTKRQPITISLLDEAGATSMVWTLLNAWPTKIAVTNPDSDANQVVIETIEIVHEGIIIDSP